MRILHVTDGYRPQLGGIEIFVEDLATRQAEAGHEVSVLTATAGVEAAEGERVRVIRTPPTVVHPLAPLRARETALAGAYDVVHSHLSVLSMFSTAVARATDEAGIPTVNSVHSMWGGRRAVVRATGLVADWGRAEITWTTVSRAAAADMVGLLPEGTPIHVVPNAIDVEWWRSSPVGPRVARPVTFVSVMRMAGRKRPFALLSILEQVRALVPAAVPLRAVVIGDGPLTHRVRAEVGGRGLGSWVTIAGRRTRAQIRALYGEADVYVSPAYQESFGIAALEARAAGLPVVAMGAGGVGEFVQHDVEGLLCSDDRDMARALAQLVVDPATRTAITAYNQAQPPQCDWPRVVAAFDEVYATARARTGLRRQVHRSSRRGTGLLAPSPLRD